MPSGAPQLYRVAGAAMIAGGCANGLIAGYFVLVLGWFCVGLLWVVPLAVALGEALVGALVVAGLPLRFARAAAVVGLINGALLFDPIGVGCEAVALVLLLLDENVAWVAAGPPQPGGPPE